MAFLIANKADQYLCLSTDTKPISSITAGSHARELDTGHLFIFSGAAQSPPAWVLLNGTPEPVTVQNIPLPVSFSTPVPISVDQPLAIQSTQWYDRVVDVVFVRFDQDNVPPHNQTIRQSYTILPGQRALLTSSFLRIVRSTGTSGVGGERAMTARAFVTVFRNGNNNVINGVDLNSPHVSNATFMPSGFDGILLPGDQVRIITRDDNPEGTCNYTGIANIAVFI